MPTEADKAYVAGFIDGEGCIRIQNNANYVPQIKIASVVPEVLDHIIALYGGSKREYQPHSSNGNARRAWEWVLTGRAATLTLMQDILPYSIVKRQHVLLMIEFITAGEPSHPPTPVSATEMERRQKIFNQYKILNKRGIRSTQQALET